MRKTLSAAVVSLAVLFVGLSASADSGSEDASASAVEWCGEPLAAEGSLYECPEGVPYCFAGEPTEECEEYCGDAEAATCERGCCACTF